VAGEPAGLGEMEPTPDAYGRLIGDLDAAGARYRLIEHPPEGRTELVSALRGRRVGVGTDMRILLRP